MWNLITHLVAALALKFLLQRCNSKRRFKAISGDTLDLFSRQRSRTLYLRGCFTAAANNKISGAISLARQPGLMDAIGYKGCA